MAHIANEVSKGNLNADNIDFDGQDEIAMLGASFSRMRRSLEKAMKMLEG